MVAYLWYRSIKKCFIILFLYFSLIILKNLLIENLCLICFKCFLSIAIDGLSENGKIWLGVISQNSLIISIFWNHRALIYWVIILNVVLIRLICLILHLIQHQFLLRYALAFNYIELLVVLSLNVVFLGRERNHLNDAWLSGFRIVYQTNQMAFFIEILLWIVGVSLLIDLLFVSLLFKRHFLNGLIVSSLNRWKVALLIVLNQPHSSLDHLDVLVVVHGNRLNMNNLLLLLLHQLLLDWTVLLWKIFRVGFYQFTFLFLINLLIVLVLHILVIVLILLWRFRNQIHVALNFLRSLLLQNAILALTRFLIHFLLWDDAILPAWQSWGTLHLNMLYSLGIFWVFLRVYPLVLVGWFKSLVIFLNLILEIQLVLK
jgi:hypothetical protein